MGAANPNQARADTASDKRALSPPPDARPDANKIKGLDTVGVLRVQVVQGRRCGFHAPYNYLIYSTALLYGFSMFYSMYGIVI
jgi:hypothetical protein